MLAVPDTRIIAVPPDLLRAHVWPRAADLLAPAVKLGEPFWHIDDIPDAIERRVFDLWIAMVDDELAGAALTRIEHFPRMTCIDVPFLGGRNMRAWIRQMDEALATWGRSEGATVMTGAGRRGWCRVLGFRLFRPTLMKEI